MVCTSNLADWPTIVYIYTFMSKSYTFIEKALAFSVHIFTATGVLTAIMAIIAISDAPAMGELKMREAMLWLFAAFIIDGIDGTFARMFKAKEVLPNWDGQNIDYVIDFATYAIIPAFFIYQSDMLPDWGRLGSVFLILMVSALYYGKKGMVSDDQYFVGFPVMWNCVAFYMYFVTDFSQTTNFIFVLIFAILHFVPIKYPYPSHPNRVRNLTIVSSLVFFVTNIWILFIFPQKIVLLQWISMISMLTFGFVSLFVTFSE